MDNFNKKPCYPITYGDSDGDNTKISDYVVYVVKSEKFQRYMGSVGFAVLAVASRAHPVAAIPPEYGEAAANIVEGVGQNVPPLGDLAGTTNVGANAAQGAAQAGGIYQGPPGAHYVPGAGHYHNPLQTGAHKALEKPHTAWKLPGPPTSVGGQYGNTALLIGSVAWICLNASWGNPVFAYGCLGILGGIINELRKQYMP